MRTYLTAKIDQMISLITTKHQRAGDVAGQVVFTLAGLMILTWFLGTCLYALIPQSSKIKAVATKSKVAEPANNQLASLETTDKDSNLATTETKANSNNSKEDNALSHNLSLPAKPLDTSNRNSKKSPDSESSSNEFAENQNDSQPSLEKPPHSEEPKPEPKPETTPIPQPKLNFVGNSSPSEPESEKTEEQVVETTDEEPQPETPATEPEPMLTEPTQPETNPTTPEAPKILPGPKPDEASPKAGFQMRDWISSTGGTARMALIRRTEEGNVLVVNEAGKRFRVPFSRFSALDQKYIEKAMQTLSQESSE